MSLVEVAIKLSWRSSVNMFNMSCGYSDA